MHVLAFPGTAIVREWLVIENAGSNPCAIDPQFLQLNLRGEDASSFTHYWLVGGTSGADQGMLHESPIKPSYHGVIAARGTQEYVPWIALQRRSSPGDGLFLALEYLGSWRFAVDHDPAGPVSVLRGFLPRSSNRCGLPSAWNCRR